MLREESVTCYQCSTQSGRDTVAWRGPHAWDRSQPRKRRTLSKRIRIWRPRQDSNPQPPGPKPEGSGSFPEPVCAGKIGAGVGRFGHLTQALLSI